jgi:hypothetical protein
MSRLLLLQATATLPKYLDMICMPDPASDVRRTSGSEGLVEYPYIICVLAPGSDARRTSGVEAMLEYPHLRSPRNCRYVGGHPQKKNTPLLPSPVVIPFLGGYR